MAVSKSRSPSKSRRSTGASSSSSAAAASSSSSISSAIETTSTAVTDAATVQQHQKETLPSVEERFVFSMTQLHICQAAIEKVLYGGGDAVSSSSSLSGASIPFVSNASISHYQSTAGAPATNPSASLQYMSYPYQSVQSTQVNGNAFSTEAILQAVTGQGQLQSGAYPLLPSSSSSSSSYVTGNPLLFPPAVTGEPLHVLLARKVRTLLPQLRQSTDAARHHVVKTPREVLNELVGCLRSVLLSAFHPSMAMGGSADSETKENLFAVYVSTRTVPIEVVVQGLFLVSYVSVKVRLELLQAQLHAKLDSELESKRRQIQEFDRRGQEAGEDRSERKLAREALLAQLMKLETTGVLRGDLKRIFDNILLTFSACCMSVGEESLVKANDGSIVALGRSNANVSEMVRVLTMLYYQLGDWMLMAERADEMTSSSSSSCNVRITSVDEDEGIIRLRRESKDCSWGIFLNESGELIGIDTGLRFTSGKNGARVHELLRRSGGLRVLGVNNLSLTDPTLSNSKHVNENNTNNNDNNNTNTSMASPPNSVMVTIGSEAQKRMQLALHVDITGENSITTAAAGRNRTGATSRIKDKTGGDVRELSFWVHNQGGEGATGQRATLALHRMDENTPWGLTVDRDLFFIASMSDQVPSALETTTTTKKQKHKQKAQLDEPSFQTALSGASLAFFATHRSRVKMFSINGVHVQEPQQVVELTRHVDTIQVEFILTDPPMGQHIQTQQDINKVDQGALKAKKSTPTPKATPKAIPKAIPATKPVSPPSPPPLPLKDNIPLVQSTSTVAAAAIGGSGSASALPRTIKPTGDPEIDNLVADIMKAEQNNNKDKKKTIHTNNKKKSSLPTTDSGIDRDTSENNNNSTTIIDSGNKNNSNNNKGLKKSVAEEVEAMSENTKAATPKPEKRLDSNSAEGSTKKGVQDTFHAAMEELNEKIDEAANEEEVEELILAAEELQEKIEADVDANEAAPLSTTDPVKFENGVLLESIAGRTLTFTRPSLNHGWGFRLAVVPLNARWTQVHLNQFPAFDPKSPPPPKDHPIHKFIQRVQHFPRIESVSGVHASTGDEMVEVMRRALRVAIKMRMRK